MLWQLGYKIQLYKVVKSADQDQSSMKNVLIDNMFNSRYCWSWSSSWPSSSIEPWSPFPSFRTRPWGPWPKWSPACQAPCSIWSSLWLSAEYTKNWHLLSQLGVNKILMAFKTKQKSNMLLMLTIFQTNVFITNVKELSFKR